MQLWDIKVTIIEQALKDEQMIYAWHKPSQRYIYKSVKAEFVWFYKIRKPVRGLICLINTIYHIMKLPHANWLMQKCWGETLSLQEFVLWSFRFRICTKPYKILFYLLACKCCQKSLKNHSIFIYLSCFRSIILSFYLALRYPSISI